MINLRDLVRRVNQLSIRRNLSWDDIKYDADAAIERINSFLGALYPKMTDIMIYDDSTYSMRVKGVDREIFPEKYIHSIVIPSIAMEVLARDEEFTTIYNKYAMQVEDGLFDMFSNEFNRVPFQFRQNPDVGVFFASDHDKGKAMKRKQKQRLPVYTFRVFYHVNNPHIGAVDFVQDLDAHLYNAEVALKDWTTEMIDDRGTYAYKFLGWSRLPNEVTTIDYVADENGNVDAVVSLKQDLHLYAVWKRTPTLSITAEGRISIKTKYIDAITNLVIPDFYNGIQVRTLAAVPNSLTYSSFAGINLQSIKLPKFLEALPNFSLSGFKGHSVVFHPDSTTPVSIGEGAFHKTPNLTSIIIPENVTAIATRAFPYDGTEKGLNIYVRRLEQNIPADWKDDWYEQAASTSNYYVTVHYGFNG